MNTSDHIAEDRRIIALQERELQFDQFNQASAWILGARIKQMCESSGAAVTIEIRLARETVFFYAMPGTTPSNADWARRKRNTVELLHQSSYAVGLALTADATSLEAKAGLPLRDYVAHGGGFPIRVRNVGCIGVATISGLPQRADHAVVAQAIADMLGVSMEHMLLTPQ